MTAPTTLACPNCESTSLRSDEVAAIGYPVIMRRNDAGQIEPEYIGDGYEVWDEGTVYSNDIWCRNCGVQVDENDLIEVTEA